MSRVAYPGPTGVYLFSGRFGIVPETGGSFALNTTSLSLLSSLTPYNHR